MKTTKTIGLVLVLVGAALGCGGEDTETSDDGEQEVDERTSVGDCPDAELCEKRGLCGVTEEGICIVRSEEECQASWNCTLNGYCHRSNEFTSSCVVQSSADCAGSLACSQEGRCDFSGYDCI